jgi:hypothetical protein
MATGPHTGVTGLSAVAKRHGREANHSTPINAEVMNQWSYTSVAPVHFHGVEWNFTFLPCTQYAAITHITKKMKINVNSLLTQI